MGIKDINIVDSIGTSITKKNTVSLLISDNLDWENEHEHMVIMQNKINTYLNFIESSEIYSKFPKAKGKQFEILIYATHRLTPNAKEFIFKVKNVISKSGYFLSWEYVPLKDEGQERAKQTN